MPQKHEANLVSCICSHGFLLKVKLSEPLVQRDTLSRRGCLVVVGKTNFFLFIFCNNFPILFHGKNLFHLGGVTELVDTLNMGEQV